MEIDNTIDLTACIPQGKAFKIDDTVYTMIFNYRMIRNLEKEYGTINAALDAFQSQTRIYDDVINFLYAGLYDTYQLEKQEIEQWLGTSTLYIFYNLIYNVILLGYGTGGAAGEGAAVDMGEQTGGTTGI